MRQLVLALNSFSFSLKKSVATREDEEQGFIEVIHLVGEHDEVEVSGREMKSKQFICGVAECGYLDENKFILITHVRAQHGKTTAMPLFLTKFFLSNNVTLPMY